MNNNCWYNLNIDVTGAIRTDIGLDVTDDSWHIKSYDKPNEIFNSGWIEYFRNLGFTISHTMVFRKPKNHKCHFAHIDGYLIERDDTSFLSTRTNAINWVIGSDDGDMVWYQTPREKNEVLYTAANTPYLSWPVNQLTEIDRCRQSQYTPTLLRVNVPHNIEINGNARISVSVRTITISNNWSKAVELMRNKNILIER